MKKSSLAVRLGMATLCVVLSWFGLSALRDYLDPNEHKTDELREDAKWIATSTNWLDRQACRWVGICGIAHWHPDPPTRAWNKRREGDDLRRDVQEPLQDNRREDVDSKYVWEDIPGLGEKMKPGDWAGDARVLKEVPQYVLDHAPLIHLCSREQFWPSDIAEHLMNTTPFSNHTFLNITDEDSNVDNLLGLNEGRRGRYVFLNSKVDVEERPEWLSSAYNKPIPYDDDEEDADNEDVEAEEEAPDSIPEYTEDETRDPTEEDLETWWDPYGPAQKKTAAPLASSFRAQSQHAKRSKPLKKRIQPVLPRSGGYSRAPVILVLVDKGHGIIDAFWFYFYSYNLGTTVLNIRFGNHVGDWEHSLIRFHNGVPKAVFFSAHSGGLAYSYDAVEKGKGKGREGRPVLYSALGSHAMYAQPGSHPYILPFGLLADVTDKGPLWDPAQNYIAYHYNTSITHDVDARFATSNLPSKQMTDSLQPAANNPKAPMGWWWFSGHWGDKFYELGDMRQWRFAGQYHYVNGPLGPRFKNLGRSRVCQSRGACRIVDSLKEGKKRSWTGQKTSLFRK